MKLFKTIKTSLVVIGLLVFIFGTIVYKTHRFGECLFNNSFLYCSFTQKNFLFWDWLYPFEDKKSF